MGTIITLANGISMELNMSMPGAKGESIKSTMLDPETGMLSVEYVNGTIEEIGIVANVVAAVEAKDIAVEKAQVATDQAIIATAKAGEALASANIAGEKEVVVLAKAVEVNADAQTATDKAQIATEQAGIATAQAVIAVEKAGVATTQADIAVSEAAAAGVSADLAVDKAEEAEASAILAANNILNGVATHNNDMTAHPSIIADIRSVEAIARGRATAKAFNTWQDMENWLGVPENVETLVVGDNLYIRDVGVKDQWWDGTTHHDLESEAPDLTDYYTKTQTDALLPIIITQTAYDALVAAGTLEAGRIYYVVGE